MSGLKCLSPSQSMFAPLFQSIWCSLTSFKPLLLQSHVITCYNNCMHQLLTQNTFKVNSLVKEKLPSNDFQNHCINHQIITPGAKGNLIMLSGQLARFIQ